MTDTVRRMDQAPDIRKFVLFAVSLAMALFALSGWTAKSEAATICVPASWSPTTPPAECGQFLNLGPALLAAESNGTPDEILIKPGNYTGNFSYDSTGEVVDISGVGANSGDTVITLASTAGSRVGLVFHAAAGSKVSNLQVTVPSNSDTTQDLGIDASGTNEGDVILDHVKVDGPQSDNATGVRCGNCILRNSNVDLTTTANNAYNIAVTQNGGMAHVEGSSLTAGTGFVHGSPNETSTISRSRIKAQVGATTDGGFIDIDNTLILLDDKPGATGLSFHNGNDPDGSLVLGGNLDHVTIVNDVDNASGDSSTGIRAIADTGPGSGAGKGPETVIVNLTNSVIDGFSNFPTGRTLDTRVDNGGVLNFTSDYSAYNNGLTAQGWDGDGSNFHYSLGDHHLDIETGAGFLDAFNGDFTPGPNSPLLDAGDPANPAPGALDINGNPRACHGTDDGAIRRDIGAFERVVVTGDDCTYPETTISAKPDANSPSTDAHFEFTSTKSPGTFLCSLDGGTETVCPSPFNLSGLDAGGHTITVRARDQYGNVDQTQESYFWDIHPQDPTCENDPSLCPIVDKTAPKILGLKFPKKTRASKVKVRFRSNEAGVTFTCKLNKGKAKKCKSPWSTPRLKKGKNTISIQATDKAGNKSRVVKRNVKRIFRRK